VQRERCRIRRCIGDGREEPCRFPSTVSKISASAVFAIAASHLTCTTGPGEGGTFFDSAETTGSDAEDIDGRATETAPTGGQTSMGSGTRLDVGGPGGGEIHCGDGILTTAEACDDGNEAPDDGCAQDCRSIEVGWVCPAAGERCRRFARCGDGVAVFPEQCDDGNLVPDDGCSPTCKIEVGWKCDDAIPSGCSTTVCADDKLEGAETCEDEDTLPFDGCGADCQAEPTCTDDGCVSRCGDGLIIQNEACDDGNATNGDGCSANCEVEPGYVCEQGTGCAAGQADCPITLPIVFRDFNVSHVDFHEPGAAIPTCEALVSDALDEAGKPRLGVQDAACIHSAESFAEWYGAVAGEYATILGSMTLFPNGAGGYVNRHGQDGEPFAGEPVGSGRWCGNPEQQDSCGTVENEGACNGEPFDPDTETCWEVGSEHGPGVPIQCCLNCFCAGTVEQNDYDGNPLFFPIDEHPSALEDTRHPAQIPETVYEGNWAWEAPGDVASDGTPGPEQPLHNFHFTSEIAYWFEYQGGGAAELTFIGDDDVWVFVNRQLVLDLGGIHSPWAGRFSLEPGGNVTMRTWIPPETELASTEVTAASLGLEEGGVYEIKVFHADRRPAGSSFQLTLSGFNTARSECRSICGDAILAAGEECDLGEELNVGGHNGCNADCTLGTYCGDGTVQPEEECDDRDPLAPPNCFGCRLLNIG